MFRNTNATNLIDEQEKNQKILLIKLTLKYELSC